MSFTPNILWDPHVILPPLPFFLLPPSLSPLSFPPSAFLFTLARAAAVVAVGTTVGNGGAVAMVGRRRRSSDERASSPTGATVGTRLSPDCRLERVASPRIPAASLDRSSASPSSELRALLRPDDRPPSSPWGHCRYPGSIVAVSHHVPLSANRHPLLVSSPPPRRRRPLRQSTPHPLLASAAAANEGHRAPLVLLVRRRPFISAIGRTGGES